jgi:hypothetical protein
MVTSPPGPPEDSEPLSSEAVQLLVRAYEELMALLPAERNCDEFIELGRASHAGAYSARAVLTRYGTQKILDKIAWSTRTLRATGHFAAASRADALADLIRSWERRAVRRNSRPG